MVIRALVLTVLIVAFVSGCAAPSLATSTSRGCADTIMAQIASTKPVKGSFECFGPAMQNRAHMYGISNDAELAASVGTAGVRVTYVGTSPDGYVYVVDGGQLPTPVAYIVHVDKNGKVDAVA
jgi:hypothetical protein